MRFCEIYVGVLSRSLIVDQADSAAPSVIFRSGRCRSRAAKASPAQWRARSRRGSLTAAPSGQKRLIDPLDEDTTISHRFDAVRYLYDFASAGIAVGERVTINELHAAARSFFSAPRITILSAGAATAPSPRLRWRYIPPTNCMEPAQGRYNKALNRQPAHRSSRM